MPASNSFSLSKAIIGFFDGAFEYEGRTFQQLTDNERELFENYEITIVEIIE